MTRTPTADIPTADLVARTLQAVADAVPVAQHPPAATTDQPGLTPTSTTDHHGTTRAGAMAPARADGDGVDRHGMATTGANRDGDGGGVDRQGMAPTGTTDRRGMVGGGATAPATGTMPGRPPTWPIRRPCSSCPTGCPTT